ncbi:putative diacylglycerol O-acyltransferase tgs1 [Folsomia candida]|uniref:Putative diacylglycerol O-acyltransferase tgs1 n=1 Tax=Folsomia candida TaxID=158441 RepID=A0A226DQU3_FOLCA|nr:putative diacylglycerol O-acyltransferase tgs1 [Folsomia candida]
MAQVLHSLIIFVQSVLAYFFLPLFALFIGIMIVWRKCVNIVVQIIKARDETWIMLPASATVMDFPEIQNVEDPHDMNKLSNYLLRGRRWKEGKPLWEVLLLRNKGVKSLVIFRIHHVIGDGHSILNMWDKVFTTKDARPVLQGAPVQQKRDESSLDKICSVILAPYHLVKLFRSLSMNRDKLPCIEADPEVETVCAASTEGLPMTEMKAIRAKFHVSFLPVLLAGLAGAVRQSFVTKGIKIPEKIPVLSIIPRGIHPEQNLNHGTICIILLPVGESDPVQRLKMISTSVTSYIKSSLPNFLYLIGLCEGSLPIPLVRAINKNPKDDVPLVLTNVVGPPNRCFVAGEEIARIQMGQNIPLQFSSGFAYGIAFLSYDGDTTLGAIGLEDYFPNLTIPQKIMADCINEWKVLLDANIDKHEGVSRTFAV